MIPGIKYLKVKQNGAAPEMTDGLQFFLGCLRIRGYHQLHQLEQLLYRLSNNKLPISPLS